MTRFAVPLVVSCATLALAACSSTGQSDGPGMTPAPRTATGTCDIGDFAQYVGGSPTAIQSAPEASNLAVRMIRDGEPVTLDFNPSRLNVETGEDGLVSNVYCG